MQMDGVLNWRLMEIEQQIKDLDLKMDDALENIKPLTSYIERTERLVDMHKDLLHQLSALQIRLAAPSGEIYARAQCRLVRRLKTQTCLLSAADCLVIVFDPGYAILKMQSCAAPLYLQQSSEQMPCAAAQLVLSIQKLQSLLDCIAFYLTIESST